MNDYTLTHLSDDAVLRNLAALVARDRPTTALLLAYLGEMDSRKLYVPAGHSSMFAYCTDELHMSEDVACKRIAAARAARNFPVLFPAIADGRLHVSGVTVLAPHLDAENVVELMVAATHRKKAEIEDMIAARASAGIAAWAHPSVPAMIRRLPATTSSTRSAPGRVAVKEFPLLEGAAENPAPGVMSSAQKESSPDRPQAPVPPVEQFLVQFGVDVSERDLLQHVHALLSHAEPFANVKQVFMRALRFYATHLEKRKFGALKTGRRIAPGTPGISPPGPRRDRGRTASPR